MPKYCHKPGASWRGGKLARTKDELEGVIEERLGALRADGLLGVAGNADLECGCGLEDAALVPGLVDQVVCLAASHVQHPALQVKQDAFENNECTRFPNAPGPSAV